MKRFAVAALLLVVSVAMVRSQGQESANYWAQAFVRVTNSAAGAADTADYGYQEGISILGAWIKHRDSCDFVIHLTRGVKYLFVAGGDKDALDLNVEIIEESGKVVAKDEREAPDVMVNFSPPASDWYTMRLSLAKSKMNSANVQVPCICVVCVLRENGIKVPIKSLDQAGDKLMTTFVEADRLMKPQNKRLELRHARNQWAIYGTVIAPGASTRVTNLDLGTGRRVFLSIGDDNSQDVDLFLMDGNDNVIAKDVDARVHAIIGFDPLAGRRYAFRMLNYKGNGPSVVLTGFFDPYPIRPR